MNPLCRRAVTGALVAVVSMPCAAAAQVSAEPWLRPGTLHLAAEIGGAAFSDFHRARARPVVPIADMHDFQRRVSARTSITVGTTATYWVGPGWGVRLGGAFVPTRFSVWNEESAQLRLDPSPLDEEPMHASLGVWLGSAAITFRFPRSFGRVVPYGMVGAGVAHYSLRDDRDLPAEARTQFDSGARTMPAAVLGLGATLPLEREGLLLNFELTNHLSRSPIDSARRSEPFDISGVSVELAPGSNTSGLHDTGMTSNLRLTLGFTMAMIGRR
ncbi:hypothetical protein BH23GEM10_BH23GEM10_17250 [soil metagenome]